MGFRFCTLAGFDLTLPEWRAYHLAAGSPQLNGEVTISMEGESV